MKTTPAFAISLVLAIACNSHPIPDDLATSIARALNAACPMGADPSDETARDECAARLANLPILRDTMQEPFIWGGQAAAGSYALDKGVNKFNPRVWRRLYLSTFEFDCEFSVERVGQQTIMHIPVIFRGAMPPGAYPYPFWHSERKWNAYNYTTTLHFVIEHDQLIGALRSVTQDASRPKIPRTWDGRWRWEQAGTEEPHVSIYAYLLSKDSPHAARLDASYRALELAMRKHNCASCHAPNNIANADQLEFFVYPNQALTGRHDIVTQLIDNVMPPADENSDAGIANAADRDALIALARDFETVGDAALAWENAR